MSKPRRPAPVKLFAGMLSSGDSLFEEAAALLEKDYGPADYTSRDLPFEFTRYYENEIGSPLCRRFIFFKNHVDPERLAAIKIDTISKEKYFSLPGGRRKVNIDPGYVDAAKVVLATTKNYSHRIYLSRGIFAEVTLHFRGGSFAPWEWTYPDYRTEEYIEIFNRVRRVYLKDAGHRKKEGGYDS